MFKFKKNKTFTLIELLIVVAIIAILAAIAVPNFLQAQTRAKVSRCHADMRSIANALEEYMSDYNFYPFCAKEWGEVDDFFSHPRAYAALTTPEAYLSSVPSDPFSSLGIITKADPGHQIRNLYLYKALREVPALGITLSPGERRAISRGYSWFVHTVGPAKDQRDPENPTGPQIYPSKIASGVQKLYIYDSSNGTTSFGYIIRSNKGIFTGADWKPKDQ